MKWITFIVFIFCNQFIHAQHLLKNIPINNAHVMQVDDAGNVYIGKKDKTIIKYNENGDSLGYYNNLSFGKLSSIDANNPLLLMLYYNNYNQVVILDRLLNEKNIIDLKQIQLYQVYAIALSYDNKLLIYDAINATIKKLDENLEVLLESNDLRQEIGQVIQATQIIDRDSLVYLVAKNVGVYVFDRMLNYLHFVPIDNISNTQKISNQLVYFTGDSLFKFDLNSYTIQQIFTPAMDNLKILDVKLSRNRMYCLTDKGLFIYEN